MRPMRPVQGVRLWAVTFSAPVRSCGAVGRYSGRPDPFCYCFSIVHTKHFTSPQDYHTSRRMRLASRLKQACFGVILITLLAFLTGSLLGQAASSPAAIHERGSPRTEQ